MTENIQVFDNTMIKAFQSCPRYYYWRHIRHLTTRTKPLPLLFGIAIHEGMETYYKTNDDVKAIEAFAQSFGLVEGDDKRNLDNGARILASYMREYPIAAEPWEIVHVEKGFEIVLEEGLHYCGRIDMIIEWSNYGKLIVDHKTASWISDNYMKAHATDRQFSGYIVGMKQYFPKVYGAMVNVLEVPKTLKRDPKVQRELTTRSEVDQALWVVETKQIVAAIRKCEEATTWPMNAPFYCTAWNRLCDYFPLCTSKCHPDNARIPEEAYVVEEWLPFVSEGEAVR